MVVPISTYSICFSVSGGFKPLQEELFVAKGSCADHGKW